jgi:RNA polymerase sigma-70 factor, ECF subfamily
VIVELKVLPAVFGFGRSRPMDLDVRAVHRENADFVFMTLQRLGVRPADLEDLCQEVFVVVHRRLRSYDGSSKLSTWLFAICAKVASSHRRSAPVRREELVEDFMNEPFTAPGMDPEEAAAKAQARRQLDELLDTLSDDKRAIFVMFEIEALSCDEIAQALAIPLGTVHSRLHAARKAFEAALKRHVKRASSPPASLRPQASRGMS